MSDKEEGELESGEEDHHQPLAAATSSKAAKTSDSVDVPSIVSLEKKGNSTAAEDMYSDRREFNDKCRKPRRVTKPHAFNEVSNSKQKFVSRRVNKSRFGSPPPNRNHYDDPPIFNSTLPNPEVSPPKPTDSWRQDPVPSTAFPIVSPRRPLLPLPNPFASQAAPSALSFFNQSSTRSSFAPPPYRPLNPTPSTFFSLSQPRPTFGDSFPRENLEPLAARQSIDMDISPTGSPLMTENCVMFVDEPLEETPSPEAHILLPTVNNTITPAPIPYVVEPGTFTIPQHAPVEDPFPTQITVSAEAGETPPSKKMQKKFTKDLLEHIQSVLLGDLDNESPSSSSSEFDEDAKEVDELRRKLIHHNKEMHDELDKRERLVKDMETCQLMINHHYERMNTIMRSIGDASRQSLRHARKSLSRTKSEGKKKRKKLCNNFGDRVAAILNELSVMDEEIITTNAPGGNDINTPEKPDESSELAEVLGNLIEDSGVEFNQSMDNSSADVVESPKRVERQLFVDKAFENECLRRMFQARFGIQPLPHIVIPSRRSSRKAAKKKNSDASVDGNIEKEEAMRRKLLEQMKRKELFPSLHEKRKDVENETIAVQKANQAAVVEETVNLPTFLQTLKPLDVSTVPETVSETINAPVAVKPFKSVADICTVPNAIVEKPKIVPTMKDIMELKKELRIALTKRRSGKKDSKVSSLPLKNSPVKQNSDFISKMFAPVKFATSLPKPVEKENVGNTEMNPLKRAASSGNNNQAKKARLIPVEKPNRLDEFEMREQEILFNSPRIALRNFILSPQYNIKESIERLRHRNDPNIELCYFELFGICNDDECPYQHKRDFTLNDQQILEEILGYIPHRTSRPESIQQQAKKLLESNSLDEVIEDLRKETSHLDFIKLAVESSSIS